MDEWYVGNKISIAHLNQALQDSRLQWVYAERMEDTLLTRCDALLTNSTVALERWIHGRAFGPDLELAWWREGQQIRARVIVAMGEPPTGAKWQPYTPPRWEALPQDRQIILLVGERDPEAPAEEPLWSTAQIPWYLTYPVDGSARRVALVEQGYRQQDIIVARRLVQVQQAV